MKMESSTVGTKSRRATSRAIALAYRLLGVATPWSSNNNNNNDNNNNITMTFSLNQQGEGVMSSQITLTQLSNTNSLAHIPGTPAPWFSVVALLLQFITTASWNGIPPLQVIIRQSAGGRSERTQGHAKIIIIYQDFLPKTRRGSHVKSDKTHTVIKIHPLAHILDTWALIFSSCALFTVYPNRIM